VLRLHHCKGACERGEKISTLKIRVKRRLSIWCHRPGCEFFM
jgi:hypothetical protein